MRAPDKTRFLRAVRHIEVEELPFVEADPDIVQVNRILGQRFPFSLHAYELPVPDYIELNRRMGNDMIYFVPDFWRLGRREMTDRDGRIHYVDGVMKTRASLKDIRFPDLAVARRHLEATLAAVDGTGFGLLCAVKFAPAVVNVAVGMQDYWIACIEDPSFVHDFQARIHAHCLRELELLIEYRVDAIGLGIAVGMKSGPLCSHAMLEEFQYPMLRDQIRMAKSAGIPVRLHVDGNVSSLIPDFIAMGVDLLHPLEPCEGQLDIYDTKRRYGDRIALHGNIDITGVLTRGTPEDVRRDTIAHMRRLAPGGGYVVGSSHDIGAGIPLENFYAMRDAVHSYRHGRSGHGPRPEGAGAREEET